MSRPKLSSPDQPALVRWSLRLYEFAASLSLAVILIASSAFALGLATFVEAAYGASAVHFYVYRTWWFELILVLLAVNIFCAAAIRYPWKRHQTGFVITHIGLLTLLLGAFIGRYKGIDAQVSVFEGESDKWAIENAVDLKMSITRPGGSGSETDTQQLDLRFAPGLFNWVDWNEQFAWQRPEDEFIEGGGRIPWQAFRYGSGAVFRLASQNQPGDVIYDRDGIKLEVLDYYSDSRVVNAPAIELKISLPQQSKIGADGKTREEPVRWMPLPLNILALPNQPEYPFGWCPREATGGGSVTFQLAGSAAQTAAFLKSVPEGELGAKGQAIIYAGGELTRIDVAEKLGQERFPLDGKSGLEAQVVEQWPQATLAEAGSKLEWRKGTGEEAKNPAVKIKLFRDGKELSELLLLAIEPNSNVQDHKNQIYGEYWWDYSKRTTEEVMAAKDGITARIDILQGTDEKLYYRYWNRKDVVIARELPTEGSEEDAVDAFKMPIAQLKMYVSKFTPASEPTVVPEKHEFVKGALIGDPQVGGRYPAGKFRLTVDDKSEEFWLFPDLTLPDVAPTNRPNREQRIQTMQASDGRVVSLTMPINALDIGFRVRLNKFERKLDPGTEQASDYASWVDIIDHDADRGLFQLSPGGRTPQALLWPGLKRPTSLAFDAKSDYVYWIDSAKLAIMRAKWSEVQNSPQTVKIETVLGEGLRKPTSLVLDAAQERLYFVDSISAGRTRALIRSVSVEGEKLETVAALENGAEALVLDPKEDRLYFASRGQSTIGRVNTSGKNLEEVWFNGATRPQSLAMDLEDRKLLWSEAGSTKNAIREIGLETEREALVVSRGPEQRPLAIALDPDGERLFFIESLPNAEQTENKKPTSKPLRWRIVSTARDGSDERVETDTLIDEPSDLVWTPGGALAWTQTALTHDDVWITMNAPIDCFDPLSKRSYRLFQESFSGPFRPGEGIFEQIVPRNSPKTDLYRSVLTVNYDPGRGIRNVGCLLVCLGIATMFYMRAYFFKPKARVTPPTAKPAATPLKADDLVGASK